MVQEMNERSVEGLEHELRNRAFAHSAELMVSAESDRRFRAAYVRFVDPVARQGVVLLEVTAADKQAALEGLLEADGGK
jgi:hypothetical protein